MEYEIATFAAGCFWGVEAKFRKLDGVIDTMVGYTGGHVEDPNYRQVCTDTTGHAEAVQIQFDPQKITYQQLVEAFYQVHNPTTPNRQGPDFGSQYRSAIFYHTDAQKEIAETVTAFVDFLENLNTRLSLKLSLHPPFIRPRNTISAIMKSTAYFIVSL